MSAYYNEIDGYCVQWLRNLIDRGLIADGIVDERSIEDVKPSDLHGFTQCHFFAGIGGWSYALRLAKWSDDQPVWTGSCPCQPFSTAGKRVGFADERHLWPAWQYLVGQCKPAVVFGEQVASKDGYAWLDLVQTDLEGLGYAFGPVVLPAAGFGAPHGRHRIFFVADARHKSSRWAADTGEAQSWRTFCNASGRSDLGSMVFSDSTRRFEGSETAAAARQRNSAITTSGDCVRSPTNGIWRDADWLRCRDGKWRAVEPGTFPLAHGTTARMGRLRAYGNAIVPQVAAGFIEAFMEVRP